MKKKVLSLFLVALLLLVQLTVPAFAADTGKASPVLKLAAAYNDTTKQVTATVALGPCEGIFGLNFNLRYDKAALSFNSANASGIMRSAAITNMNTNSQVKFMYESESIDGVNCEEEQIVLSVVFDVIGGGDSILTLGSIDIVVDGDEADVGEGSILSAVVTLPGSTTNPTTPTTPEPTTPEPTTPEPTTPEPTTPEPTTPEPTTPEPTTPEPTTPEPTTPEPTTPEPTTPEPTTPEPTTPEPTTPEPTTPEPTTPEPTTPEPTTPEPTTPDPDHPTDPERTIELVGENNKATYTVNGNTLNVKNNVACVVLWTADNGETYTKLSATANEAGGYDFDLTNVPENAIIKIAIKGDVNGDGTINLRDAAKVMNAYISKKSMGALEDLVADVNNNDGIQLTDASMIMNAWVSNKGFNW